MAKPSTNNKNNVLTDRDGNVFQKDDVGNVKARDNKTNSWKPVDKGSPSYKDVKKEAQVRDRSNPKTNSYNKPTAKPATSPKSKPPAASRPQPTKPTTKPAPRPASKPIGKPGIKPR